MPPFQNLPTEWQKVIRDIVRLGTKVQHGDIRIVIHEGKPALTEILIKKKPTDIITEDDDFAVRGL